MTAVPLGQLGCPQVEGVFQLRCNVWDHGQIRGHWGLEHREVARGLHETKHTEHVALLGAQNLNHFKGMGLV